MKKPSIAEKLNDLLDLAPAMMSSPGPARIAPVESELVPTVQSEVMSPEIVSSSGPVSDQKMEADFDLVRQTFHHLIKSGVDLSDLANECASENQDPRSVEVAAAAHREAREHLTALIQFHKSRKEIDRLSVASDGGKGGDTTINTAVFYGTTGDMLRLLKDIPKLPDDIDKPSD